MIDRRCHRCSVKAIWQVSADQGHCSDSCLACLPHVVGECALLWRVLELKLTAIDEFGTVA